MSLDYVGVCLYSLMNRPEFSEFYSPANTIMFDDIRRNFVMNPQNGLKIKAFRQAPLNRMTGAGVCVCAVCVVCFGVCVVWVMCLQRMFTLQTQSFFVSLNICFKSKTLVIYSHCITVGGRSMWRKIGDNLG